MPRWISKFGKWYPAPEYVVDPRAPKGQEIYSGPDRAAKLELPEGMDHLGEDYHLNPDLITRARTLGYKTVDKYLQEVYGFDKEAQEQKLAEVEKEVNEHKPPKRGRPPKIEGGGVDTAGQGEDMYGGFGKPGVAQIDSKMKD